MPEASPARVDALPDEALLEATRRGLLAAAKELPTVWLYDDRGSRLFEEITRLPEYYLTRREASILDAHAAEIAARTEAATLVELGSGTAPNARILLQALDAAGTLERFVPLDVSESTLRRSVRAFAAAHPRIAVHAVVGDFERHLDLLPRGGRRVIAFLGSTIGNLTPERRASLLTSVAALLAAGDAFVLGVDLVKDVERLLRAYDDAEGVTEAFVRNALTAVDRELGGTFEQRRFAYEARWDPERDWMDIGLRALEAHAVSVRALELEVPFAEGEWLRLEISAKFRREQIEREGQQVGLELERWWTDPAGDFAVALLTRPKGRAT
jgi:L-histidine N-alpha-methyltransferase